MQVLDRIIESNNWITIIIVFCMMLLFTLKVLSPSKIILYAQAFFLKGFIEKKTQEKSDFFSLFNILLLFFSTTTFALASTYVLNDFQSDLSINIGSFFKIFFGILGYFLAFYFLEFLLTVLFVIKNETSYFINSKITYFYTCAIWLFPILILSVYTFKTSLILVLALSLLFLISITLIIANNKNLIVSKLFYFILYLCALKIAPILIIYKIIFN